MLIATGICINYVHALNDKINAKRCKSVKSPPLSMALMSKAKSGSKYDILGIQSDPDLMLSAGKRHTFLFQFATSG